MMPEPTRGPKKRIDRKESLQATRYPITTLELILFVILVVTFLVLAFLSISLPLETFVRAISRMSNAAEFFGDSF
ncbi:MAG: hypothetical protein JO313_06225 [Verrucomicrobia bacterium]|nr:hypothetical protein [Verrucomicrobiota bacterium]